MEIVAGRVRGTNMCAFPDAAAFVETSAWGFESGRSTLSIPKSKLILVLLSLHTFVDSL